MSLFCCFLARSVGGRVGTLACTRSSEPRAPPPARRPAAFACVGTARRSNFKANPSLRCVGCLTRARCITLQNQKKKIAPRICTAVTRRASFPTSTLHAREIAVHLNWHHNHPDSGQNHPQTKPCHHDARGKRGKHTHACARPLTRRSGCALATTHSTFTAMK